MEHIIKISEKLNSKQAIILALLNLRDLLPNYLFFSNQTNFGDYSILLHIYEIAKESLLNDISINKEMFDELYSISPDSENYSSVYSTYALDVCAICYDVLSILIENDNDSKERILKVVENTIYISILEKTEIELSDREIEKHSEIKQLRDRQMKYIDLARKGVNKELIDILDTIPNKSIIGLEG